MGEMTTTGDDEGQDKEKEEWAKTRREQSRLALLPSFLFFFF